MWLDFTTEDTVVYSTEKHIPLSLDAYWEWMAERASQDSSILLDHLDTLRKVAGCEADILIPIELLSNNESLRYQRKGYNRDAKKRGMS